MATKTILDSTLTAIADAIRQKTGDSGSMTPLEMPEEIENIPTGGGGEETNFKKFLESETTNNVEELVNDIVLPATTSKLHDYAFHAARAKSITVPSGITAIPRYCFYQTRVKNGITFQGEITKIEERAFQELYVGSTGSHVIIPGSTSQKMLIAGYVFYNCIGIKKLTMGNSTHGCSTGGNQYCFSNMTALEEATIYWDYIEGARTFEGDTALQKVKYIHSDAGTATGQNQYIGARSFRNCSNCLVYDFSELKVIPALDNVSAFEGINANAKIVVPDSMYNDWIAATNWTTYASYIVKASEA